mmetsp:Transcript_50338/g.126792  ORF Transcript_50338/g.126792 Transcript_50338/m.126792 type:complete len:329 (-) Transcript_50338:66-1052(-)
MSAAASSGGSISGRAPRAAGGEENDEGQLERKGEGQLVPAKQNNRIQATGQLGNLGGALSSGYRKLGMLVEHLETRIQEAQSDKTGDPVQISAEWVLKEIDRFAQGLGKWLKVAGDDKSEILRHTMISRPMTEHKTMVEFGAFVGYTSCRMGRQVEIAYANGYEDGSILFEDSRLQGAPRITTFEIDPIHACIARHVTDISRLSHITEVWIGQVKDLIPRLGEEFGELNINMVFMDQRGTTFHEDLSQLEELYLMFPGCRLVADNTLKPGSPVYNWHCWYSPSYETTNYSLHEFLESSIEDWQCVCDWLGPTQEGPKPMPWEEWEECE